MSIMTHHLRSRFAPALAVSLGAIALAPMSAAAATTWFGSSLNNDPANAGTSCDQNSVLAPNCTHIGSYYPGTSGRVKATVNGTIVRIRVHAEGPMTMRFALVRVRNLSSDETQGLAKMIASGPTIQVMGPTSDQAANGIYPIESFRVHIKVHKGDELAITTDNNQAEYCADGTPGQLTFYNPFLSRGQGFLPSSGVDYCLLLVQAVVKH